MDKKILFQKALTSLVEYAATKHNLITMEEVKQHFTDLIDDDSQYLFIYDYLATNKIEVEGFHCSALNLSDNSTNHALQYSDTAILESEEELTFIRMYMSDLEMIEPAQPGEVDKLLKELSNGSTDIVNRLVECHLSIVADIAKSYRGKGVTFGDLIQEGNIALMVAISDYQLDCGDFSDFITQKIRQSMEAVIHEQINSDRVGKHLADQLNRLDKVTKQLNEELGRIPEIAELAEAMSISEEEVSVLLKTSLDTLSLNDETEADNETDSTDLQTDTLAAKKGDPLTWRVNKK